MNKNNIITALLIIAVAALVAIEFSIVASMQQQKRLEQKMFQFHKGTINTAEGLLRDALFEMIKYLKSTKLM
jgi:hypothetical protein